VTNTHYATYMIAYLDILGFKARVQASRSDPTAIEEIGDMLERVGRMVSTINSSWEATPGVRARMFSDTILLSCPNPDWRTLLAMCQFVVVFQALMIEKMHFLRGALVVGDHFERGDIAFGPALIEAYEMERLAIWPRVIVHPNVMRQREIGDVERMGEYYIRRDRDGLAYLDYLTGAFVMFTAYESVLEYLPKEGAVFVVRDVLSKHKSAIEGALEAAQRDSRLDLFTKYHSLAEYHNMVVKTLCGSIPDRFEYDQYVRTEPEQQLPDLYEDMMHFVSPLTKGKSDEAEERLMGGLEAKFNTLPELKRRLESNLICLQEFSTGPA
jgi:hypothetical protein